MKLLADMHFRFAEKRRPERYTTYLSEHVKWPTPRDLLLSGPALVWESDEELVHKILDELTVENGRVVVMAKEHPIDGPWLSEKWYETEYQVEKLDDEFLHEVIASVLSAS